MDDVARIRNRIDELDQEIVRLLKNRHENAKVLGRIKVKGASTIATLIERKSFSAR